MSPADDPIGAKRLLDLAQSLGLNEQYKENADSATTRLTLEESALGAATNVLQRVRELTVQANSSVLSDGDRRALGQEVAQRLAELLGLSNTKDGNNEYLFAGFSTGTRPFSDQGTTFAYHGDEGQRHLSLGPGFEIAVGDSGTRVFRDIRNGNGTFRTLDNPGNTGSGVIDAGRVVDQSAFVPDTYTISFPSPATFQVVDSTATVVASGTYSSEQSIAFSGAEVTISGAPAVGDIFQIVPAAAQDVFTTLDALASALDTTTTNDADRARVHNALSRALVDIDQAMENLSTVRSSVGARLNVAQSERFVAEDFGLQIQASISAIQDVDVAEAVTRLSAQTAALEAAQRSFAVIQRLSLFDFI